MLDEKRALKLVNDVMLAADALESAKEDLQGATNRVNDSMRALDIANTALKQFLGLK